MSYFTQMNNSDRMLTKAAIIQQIALELLNDIELIYYH